MRDIKRLDLNLLKALSVLLEERSVTRAAARLGLTQPAVSGMLLRLRASFDDPLLVRGGRGMVPTHRALELGPAVSKILAELEGLLEPPMFDPAQADFTLAIAASDYALSVLIEPFFTSLRELAPGVRTLVRPLSRGSIGRQLETGEVDLALMVTESNPPPHVHDLFDEHFVCIMREGHPAAEGAWTLDRFCSLDHALVAFDGGFEGITDAALALAGRTRRVVLSVSSFLVLGAVVRSTEVVAIAPARLIACVPGLIQRPPPLPLPGFTLSAGWHDRSHNDPSHAWARSLMVQASEQLLGDLCA